MARPKEPVSGKVDFEQLTLLCSKGFTDQELAEFYKVSRMTIDRWKADEEFVLHLKKGKDFSDEKVKRSLFERATGYSQKSTKFFCYEGQIISEEYIEHFPPDTTAAIFWLKNRQPDEWRDKREVNNTGETTITVKRDAGANS